MLTVLIATHNGGDTLSLTLQEFTRLQAPAGGWKLVIVDNGSSDNTREVVERFRTRLPLTYLFEGLLGKNAALNTGLSQLEGDLVVFTDDDAFPRPDWLVRLRERADDQPTYAMFGGVILPRWECPPPAWVAWFPPEPFYSITDPGLEEGRTSAGSLFGPNMAIRAEVFKQGTRLDQSIGPCGRDYPMGGETELVLRLSRQGHKAWHVRGAVVEHYIRKYQMEKAWALRRSIHQGRGQYRLSQMNALVPLPRWPAIALYLAPRMCRRLMRIAMAWPTANERKLLIAQRELNYNWGILVEAYRMRRERSVAERAELAGERELEAATSKTLL